LANVASTSAKLGSSEREQAIFAMPADGDAHCGVLSIAADGEGALTASEPVIIDDPCQDPQIMAVMFPEKSLPNPAPRPLPDLALLTGGNNAKERHLYVLWNDGSGHFSAQNSVIVSPLEESPQAFTVLPFADGTNGLAYITKGALRLLRAPNLREFAAPEALLGDRILSGGTGIVGADVNGDRVTDLVFSESGRLSVLRAQLKVP
jgi:hypothetical protein